MFRRQRTSPRHDLIGVRMDLTTQMRWRNVLRPKENPWLQDFKLGDRPHVSPAALICTAVEAGRQISLHQSSDAFAGVALRDIAFECPLFLQGTETDVYTDLRPLRRTPGEYELSIFTIVGGAPTYHCEGYLTLTKPRLNAVPLPSLPGDVVSRHRPLTHHMGSVSAEAFYADCANGGSTWGKCTCHVSVMSLANQCRAPDPATQKHCAVGRTCRL